MFSRAALRDKSYTVETVCPRLKTHITPFAESLDALARTVYVGKELVRDGKHETHVASIMDRPRPLASAPSRKTFRYKAKISS